MEAIISIVGFLGAGKTTLLKHIVKHYTNKNWKPCVVLNDYENAYMDAQQFTTQIELNSIKALTGSCICCSGIEELRNIVNRIPEREDGITLIEANGTSDACALMEFLGVGLKKYFLPPIQISVVDVNNWQKRGIHNVLEANQIQVSSLIVLMHISKASKNRQSRVIESIKKINPYAKITTLDNFDTILLTTLTPSKNKFEKLEHKSAHWSSCSVDLPILPNLECINAICLKLPKSILRVKGCTKIAKQSTYTYFERTPDGKVLIRAFNGKPITGPKLLTIGNGSQHNILEEAIQWSLNQPNTI